MQSFKLMFELNCAHILYSGIMYKRKNEFTNSSFPSGIIISSKYVPDKTGDFVDVDTGQIVGKHTGLHKWTVGQRARLGGFPAAYFIARKDVEKNIIYVVSYYF